METLLIKVPEKKSALVKQLLKELGVTFEKTATEPTNIPNALTKKTIEDAHKGVGLAEPISDISTFIKSL